MYNYLLSVEDSKIHIILLSIEDSKIGLCVHFAIY